MLCPPAVGARAPRGPRGRLIGKPWSPPPPLPLSPPGRPHRSAAAVCSLACSPAGRRLLLLTHCRLTKTTPVGGQGQVEAGRSPPGAAKSSPDDQLRRRHEASARWPHAGRRACGRRRGGPPLCGVRRPPARRAGRRWLHALVGRRGRRRQQQQPRGWGWGLHGRRRRRRQHGRCDRLWRFRWRHPWRRRRVARPPGR